MKTYAITVPFQAPPSTVRDRQGRELKPYAIVGGLSHFAQVDTPEKVAGILKPLPIDVRHATLTSERPYDRIELHDYGTPETGPIHGCRVVEEDGVRDILGRIYCDLVVGYTPEEIAQELAERVRTAFRNHPDYRDGKPLDEPTPLGEVATAPERQ